MSYALFALAGLAAFIWAAIARRKLRRALEQIEKIEHSYRAARVAREALH